MPQEYEGDDRRSNSFRLSREISIADIVAVVAIGIPALIWAGRMDTRVSQVEAMQIANRTERITTDIRLDAERESLRREVKDDLKDINQKLDKLIARSAR